MESPFTNYELLSKSKVNNLIPIQYYTQYPTHVKIRELLHNRIIWLLITVVLLHQHMDNSPGRHRLIYKDGLGAIVFCEHFHN